MQIGKNLIHPSELNDTQATGRQQERHSRRILACLAVMAAFACVVGPGQQTRDSGLPQGYPIPDTLADKIPDANQQMRLHEQQTKKQNFEAINTERRKIIADESALLLKLATELKTEVDKTGKDTLSLNVVRKADMVEKLARDVKEKMKLTVGTN